MPQFLFGPIAMSVRRTQHLLDWLVGGPSRPTPDAGRLDSAGWDALIAAAVDHQVSPQLFERLLSSNGVPREVMQIAFMTMVRQKEQVSQKVDELPELLCALNAREIPTILIKGSQLATMVYPKPSHRAMCDLDLLVRRSDLQAAEEALIAFGYVTSRTEEIDKAATAKRHIPTLRKADSAIAVELHWTLAEPRRPIDVDGLWERSTAVSLGGQPARTLSPEDALLCCCLHATLDHFALKGIRPLLDVAAILTRHGQSFDWPAFSARASEWRIDGPSYAVLELARSEAGAAVPEHILTRMKPASFSPAVHAAARDRFFDAERWGARIGPASIAKVLTRPWYVLTYLFSTKSPAVACTPTVRAQQLFARYLSFVLHARSRDFIILVRRLWQALILRIFLGERMR
jgi:Uncharacterised nucleotidyltransferase